MMRFKNNCEIEIFPNRTKCKCEPSLILDEGYRKVFCSKHIKWRSKETATRTFLVRRLRFVVYCVQLNDKKKWKCSVSFELAALCSFVLLSGGSCAPAVNKNAYCNCNTINLHGPNKSEAVKGGKLRKRTQSPSENMGNKMKHRN